MQDTFKAIKDKYAHLEFSILPLSKAKKNNEIFRIDSEPFKKSNLSLNKKLQYVKLSEIVIINPSKSELQNFDENLEVTFLSMQNLGNGSIDKREKGIIKNFKSGYTYFAENDILVAKITPCMEHGKCAIATNLTNKIGFGSTEFNVFRVKDSNFLREFLFCFLNRESIRKVATDNMIGTSGRQRVPVAFYENLSIPVLPLFFQKDIEKIVKDSHHKLEQSKALYKEAESLLYESLGIATSPLTQNTRILGESQSDSVEFNAESSENNPVIASETKQSINEINPHEVPPNLAPLRGAEKERKGGRSASTLLELECEIARLSPKSETAAAVFRSAFASHQPLARLVGERGGGAALLQKNAIL